MYIKMKVDLRTAGVDTYLAIGEIWVTPSVNLIGGLNFHLKTEFSQGILADIGKDCSKEAKQILYDIVTIFNNLNGTNIPISIPYLDFQSVDMPAYLQVSGKIKSKPNKMQIKTSIMKSGDTLDFQFDNPIQTYFTGISGYNLFFKKNSTQFLRDFGISLSSNNPDDKTVQITAKLSLAHSSSKIADADSWVYVTVVAGTKDDAAFAHFGNVTGLCGGAKTINTGEDKNEAFAVLNSFHMHFTKDNHAISEAGAKVAAKLEEAKGKTKVSGSTSMHRPKVEDSKCEELSAGVFAGNTATNQYQIKTIEFNVDDGLEGKRNTTKSVTFSEKVSNVTAILSEFYMEYPDGKDHATGQILAGAMKWDGSEYLGPIPNGALKIVGAEGKEVEVTANFNMHGAKSKSSVINKATFIVIATFDSDN